MALPAGRYGVTKNQLLKIKKLPMNTIKLIEELTEKYDLLRTAAFKNSTSVVTDSTDLVESGSVYDALGFGTKNKLDAKDVYNMLAGNFVPESSVNFPAGTYTLSFTVSGTINSGSAYQPIDISTGTQKILATKPLSVGRNTVNFTTDTAITRFRVFSNTTNPLNFTDIQVESGDTATTYVPYHASVDESKVDNSVIAPVENGSNASQAYAVNDVFIRNGALCKVTSAISQGDTLSNQFTVTNVGAILTALLNA